MNDEYGGLITNINKIVDIIIENPEEMKNLNLLQLALVTDDVESIIGDDYDKDFLIEQGIDEKQTIYRGYLAYKIICSEVIRWRLDAIEYMDYLSNKDYISVAKNYRIKHFIFSEKKTDKEFINSIENNRYRKNPKIAFKGESEILNRFSLDDNKEKKEIDGYFDLLEYLVKCDESLLEYINILEIDKSQYLKLAILAIKQDEHAFLDIDDTKIDNDIYIELAIITLKKNGKLFKYINTEKIDNKTYIELAIIAVTEDASAIEFVNPDKMDRGTYLEIVFIASKEDFNIILNSLVEITSEEFHMLLERIRKEDEEYDKRQKLQIIKNI